MTPTLKIVLVLTLVVPGEPQTTFRTPMDSVAECVGQVRELTDGALRNLPQGGWQTAACEVTRDPLL
jgi:hypothetical protein